ncbi:thioester domain-containing protein [Amycolatopsis sp. H20-H5]|uniref:thioester domain-containing protein n=1 Tax=Amycolatopsis sp. H20-H5 TaxID=3046309 RepID=UPI002DB65404|nr:thioester domain-containing protein [Amycolatopsis sp. H20-H5]MEC3977109.1 thioester domain-containing protein [Amycolatopsis sp. H20-H5]
MQVRSGLVRGGIAALAAAAAMMVAAPVAGADDGAARGRVIDSAGADGFSVNFDGGTHFVAKLFGLKLSDGSMLKVYCVQIDVGLRTDQDMIERPWAKYPEASSPFNKNRDKINWVLHNGYPGNELTALGKTLAKKGATLHDGVSKEEAITATQAAVWHFSDGKNVDRAKPLPYEDADASADVLAMYDYLVGSDNAGIGQQPKPTLNISPAKADGAAGSRIGPFSVATTGDIANLTSELPEGVRLTDAEGKTLKAGDIKDGTKLYVDVPKDAKQGTGGFVLKAIGHLDTGRLFVGENYDKVPAQSLIVAESEKTQVSANAAASWTPAAVTPSTSATAPPTTPAGAPSGEGLANTGVSAAVPLSLGVLLLGAGGVLMLLVRRRRNSAS